jgi:hypothetical protein
MQRINQILNYPSVAYEDISHFFDHAIAELNTIVKIALPSVKEMVYNNTIDTSLQPNTVLLDKRPDNTTSITRVTKIPTAAPSAGSPTYVYYTSSKSVIDYAFYVYNGTTWVRHNLLYGVYFEGTSKSTYNTIPIGTAAYWVETPAVQRLDFDLCEYLPMDWWTLFVIPYVCFKFAVRNGDSGDLYQTEFTQGLQQLQTCYDVPNFVVLSEVAGNDVYTDIVKQNLNNLAIKVPTRAITEQMRVGNAIGAIFENVFDKGGWGI